MKFCVTCDEIVAVPHRWHRMVDFEHMSDAQRRRAANQLGTKLARLVKMNPALIVLAFLSALETANQLDFSRMVEKQWASLIRH
jgi:hypothetical protein